jgi:MarR family 2-MHQ and catechol resistance regulon transcriptional repressor
MKTTKQYGRKADIALSMWVKLARAAGTFGHKTDENIRTFGLTTPQFSVLETLGHLGTMLTGELTRKQLVSGGNTTVVVNNLVKRGLVERDVCTTDRRAMYVRLTPRGKKLFRQIFPKHASFVATTAAVLSEGEQKKLGELLKKLGTGIR